MKRQQLDAMDLKILDMLIENARTPYLEIGRACGVSGAAIQLRVQRLTQIGLIKGSETIVDYFKLGYETCAFMGLYLKNPSDFNATIEALKGMPEVTECYYTTGQYDLFVKIYARNNQHLLQIIHNKLQPLGLARTETLISFKEGFKRPVRPELADTNEQ